MDYMTLKEAAEKWSVSPIFIEYNEDATDGSGKINLLSQRLLRTERNRYDKVRTQELDYQH